MEYADPVLKTIAESYDEFLVSFTKKDNFKKSYILDNEAFTLGIRKRQILTPVIFGEAGAGANNDVVPELCALTFDDITSAEGIKSREELEQNLRINISRQLYRDLTSLVNASLIKFGKNNPRGITLKTFFDALKKGSKKMRKYLEKRTDDFIPHNIVKFATNTDTVIGLEISKKMNSSWLVHFLSNELRTFQFKLINNILGLNYIICHFVPGIDRNCTICDLTGNQDPEDETPLHLFYTCRTAENILNDLFDEIGTVITRAEYFSVPDRQNNSQNLVIFWLSLIVKKYFWDCRIRKCIPDFDNLKFYLYKEFKVMCNVSVFVRSSLQYCDLNYILLKIHRDILTTFHPPLPS
jgi:hypothetical protein